MWHCSLSDWANVSSIVTGALAVVGVGAYIRTVWRDHQKYNRLEEFLARERKAGPGKGQRSVLKILQEVGLTHDEILKLSFRNPNIRRRVTVDPDTGLANQLLFEYDPDYKKSK
jgi:hypothetical protein